MLRRNLILSGLLLSLWIQLVFLVFLSYRTSLPTKAHSLAQLSPSPNSHAALQWPTRSRRSGKPHSRADDALDRWCGKNTSGGRRLGSPRSPDDWQPTFAVDGSSALPPLWCHRHLPDRARRSPVPTQLSSVGSPKVDAPPVRAHGWCLRESRQPELAVHGPVPFHAAVAQP
ncbi:hypothetical protein BDA96_10G227000 [Sorghum bicolor]|uniref:Uncharacterized protein n=1 Tax=Sorghum bicolor TaxID=4558 RepID=A0A921Q677_SORBI|nr:hypothetical protein BDA96_10G227000 [Sorghum bicolor]